MRRVFIDSFFYIALVNRRDDLHASALLVLRNLIRAGNVRFITSDAVFVEIFAFTSARGERDRLAAVELAQATRDDPATSVVEQSRTLLDAGIALYGARPDKTYSLVDCMSMVICRDQGITDVLTHDYDFAQEGFTILL